MSHNGVRNWPPVWHWVSGLENKHPKGEVGILQEVKPSSVGDDSCFIIMEYEGSTYLGCLSLDDISFCAQICNLLRHNLRREIRYIGGLELDHAF
jgi:hypothetical protein